MNPKAGLAGLGTSGLLIGAIALLLSVAGALTAFTDWHVPGGKDGARDLVVRDAGGSGQTDRDDGSPPPALRRGARSPGARAPSQKASGVEETVRAIAPGKQNGPAAQRPAFGDAPRIPSGPPAPAPQPPRQDAAPAPTPTPAPTAPPAGPRPAQPPPSPPLSPRPVPREISLPDRLGNTIKPVTDGLGGVIRPVSPELGDTVTKTGETVTDLVRGLGQPPR